MATTKTGKSTAQSSEDEGGFTLAYLVAYNVAQMLGWSAILLSLVSCLVTNGNLTEVYTYTSPLLNVFQTAAVLEILHSACGLVKSGVVLTALQILHCACGLVKSGVVLTALQILHCACGLVKSGVVLTALQVFSRVFITWGVAYSLKSVQSGPSIFMFVAAWSITEVIRYAFYFFNLVGQVPYPIKWCRYTFFIVLYPIGVTGELLTVLNGLDEVKKTQIYSYSLPNTINMSFNFFYFLIFFMLSYIPVFPQLYFHMLAQRKKIISGAPQKRD